LERDFKLDVSVESWEVGDPDNRNNAGDKRPKKPREMPFCAEEWLTGEKTHPQEELLFEYGSRVSWGGGVMGDAGKKNPQPKKDKRN